MTSLINLESERDALVEQIMELAESAATADINIADGTVDPTSEANTTEQLLAKFDELETAIASKVDAIAAVIAAQKGEIDYLKSRRDYINKAIDVKTKALEKFESYLKTVVTARPNGSIKGKAATIKVVSNGGKQPIWVDPSIDDKDFPPELVTITTTFKVDKNTIRRKLAESGEDNLTIDGRVVAALQPRGTHLRIN
jgi:Siphovirus Gp157